MLFQRYLLI
uniref:Uncharacterized protein n=1 Tax=Arundo donax TaxID=35708 RepID=A0A0A9ALV3_ARUDO